MEEGNLVARQINRDILRFHRQLVYSYVWLPTKRSFHLLPPASEGGLAFPIVRAFNEGLLRPRVARAQETFELFLS